MLLGIPCKLLFTIFCYSSLNVVCGLLRYFNPSEEIQKKYIHELAKDLGTNFGLEIQGGYGGDIEVFACKVQFTKLNLWVILT